VCGVEREGRINVLNERISVLLYNPDKTAAYVDLLGKEAPGLSLMVCESDADIARSIGEADVLFVSTRFPARYLRDARHARWIQVMGAGVERFTTAGALPPAVILTRVDTGFGEKISEHVLGYMLAMSQRVYEVMANQRQRKWAPLDCRWLYGKTLGVAGVGAIGRAIARRARAFDMRVVGLDLYDVHDEAIEKCYGRDQLMEFVADLDYLSINLPLTSSTKELFHRDVFRGMRRDAIIINTARGGLVCEPDLVDALRQGRLGGAVLDVFAEEPLPLDSSLWQMENVIITPHHAGPSVPGEVVAFFLDNLERAKRGASLRGVVDHERGF
jgi:phosphoglycerate dehydrogenase-like enzyme